jgi:hypothetical protein
MDEKLVATLVGAVAGAIGYWFTTFWMKPIVRYRELKSSILSDLIFYAQVTNPQNLGERLKELYERRVESNRRQSADLTACLLELPFWYKWWIRRKGHSPEIAATQLIGFSNTTDHEQADRRVEKIKKALGLKTDRI